MLIYGSILLSLIITSIFYFLNKVEYKWWEFFLSTISTIIIVLIIKLIINSTGENYDEIWGSTIVSVFEEEPYNEWHNETCSYTTSSTDAQGNTTTTTHYYDCSHQDNYGPNWYAVTNINQKISISEYQYDNLKKQFGNIRIITNKHNNYSSNSSCSDSKGTKFEKRDVGECSYTYKINWQGTDNTRKTVCETKSYKNKIKASDLTIFNIKVISNEDADSLGLFDIPKLDDNLNYPTILGGKVSPFTQEQFRRLNGKYGPSNEMRLWILIFEDKPDNYGIYQENYWVRGNMNELVICIGKKGEEIQWNHVFSWTTNEALPIEIRNYISNMKVLNDKSWNDLYVYLNGNLDKFKRRDFKEFDYLKKQNTTTEIIIAYLFAVIISIIVNIWVIKNDYKEKEKEKEYIDNFFYRNNY
ncbi:hypothetical protein M0Q50_10645 [bacterium]|jgi:hypothetical protein|nr:hypothetical protein [bacterium]